MDLQGRQGGARSRPAAVGYLPFDFGAAWLSADPAAVFDALPVRPSRSTFDAAFAAFWPVLRDAPIVFTSSRPPSTGGCAYSTRKVFHEESSLWKGY